MTLHCRLTRIYEGFVSKDFDSPIATKFRMDRYWLLTWTTYGTWLPGDKRGFVSEVNDGAGGRVIRNIPGTPYDADWDHLRHDSRNRLQCQPIRLCHEQAKVVLQQFHQTASYRGWQLIAVAIMANHIHVVVGVPGDPHPQRILGDLKSYASRALNLQSDHPENGRRWWTESGSKRKLKDDNAVLASVAYVRDQEFPLVLWIHPEFESELGSGTASGKQKVRDTDGGHGGCTTGQRLSGG